MLVLELLRNVLKRLHGFFLERGGDGHAGCHNVASEDADHIPRFKVLRFLLQGVCT